MADHSLDPGFDSQQQSNLDELCTQTAILQQQATYLTVTQFNILTTIATVQSTISSVLTAQNTILQEILAAIKAQPGPPNTISEHHLLKEIGNIVRGHHGQ